jgi:WD40 repeat protein
MGVTAGGTVRRMTLRLVDRWPTVRHGHPALRHVLPAGPTGSRVLAVAPDGSWLAAGGRDGTLRWWDPVAGTLIASSTGHRDSITGMAVAPDGSWLATSGSDGVVKLWDPTGEALPRTLDTLDTTGARRSGFGGGEAGQSTTAGGPVCVASPDGTLLAVTTDDGHVMLHDPAGAAPARRLTGPGTPIVALAFGPAGDWLAIRTADAGLHVTGLDGTVRFALRPAPAAPTTPAKRRGTQPEPPAPPALAVAPDGSWLAVPGLDDPEIIELRDPATGAVRTTLDAGTVGSRLGRFTCPVVYLAAAPDGAWLAVAVKDDDVRLVNVASGKVEARLPRNGGRVQLMAAAPDGSWLAVIGGDPVVRVWRTTDVPEAPAAYQRRAECLAVAPDGKHVAIGRAGVELRRVDDGELTGTIEHRFAIHALAYSRDGSLLAAGTPDGAYLWNTGPDPQERQFTRLRCAVHGVVIAPDNTWLAAIDTGQRWKRGPIKYGRIRIWNLVRGTLSASLAGHVAEGRCLALSPDGKLLVSGGADGSVRVWDPATRTQLEAYSGVARLVNGVAFTPDQSMVAAAGEGRVRFWDRVTGKTVRDLTVRNDGVRAFAFAPDGDRLALVTTSRTVQIWRFADGTREATADVTCAPEAVAWLPDGRHVCVAGLGDTHLLELVTA